MEEKIQHNEGWPKFVDFMTVVEPPWRPGTNQIDFYSKYLEEYLQNNENAKALVLGSTVQTRDLCAKFEIPVVCLDINEEMYNGMTSLMKEDSSRDTMRKGSWEKMDEYFEENEFDFVFSDEIHSNMPIHAWNKSFTDIVKVLKKDGLYFNAMFGLDDVKEIMFEEVLKKYKENPEFFDSFQNRLLYFYGMFFAYNFYDKEKQACQFHKLREKFMRYADEHDISYDTLQAVWPVPDDIKDDIIGVYDEFDPPLAFIYDMLVKYFWIEDVFVDTSHEVHRFRRDFVLRPKK